MKIFLMQLPLWLFQLVRIFYGVCWIKRRQIRKAFVPYYRMSIAVGGASICYQVQLILNFASTGEVVMSFILISLFEAVLMVCIHVYMRYQDKVHIAKNFADHEKILVHKQNGPLNN